MCSVCMIQPAFVNTEITEIISFKEDFQMKKQEKNGKRSAVVFGRFCSAIALCTIIVTLAAHGIADHCAFRARHFGQACRRCGG